jgi:uncharacterized protein (TIGR02757 family)
VPNLYDYNQLKVILDKKVKEYNNFEFIHTDPIQIPHKFIKKEDIEIAGFLTATIAWGQRKSIIKNACRLMAMMDNSPYEFITTATEQELNMLNGFVHRTFNDIDSKFFINSLRNIYLHHGGLENVFTVGFNQNETIINALAHFRATFLSTPHLHRSEKHLSDVTRNSSAKRLNMFLRWMVRQDECGVDFGIWKDIPTSALFLPLDVHTGNVGRELGLLTRTQNDLKAVIEITEKLREFDPNDPVKYDYALFGIGAFEGKSRDY